MREASQPIDRPAAAEEQNLEVGEAAAACAPPPIPEVLRVVRIPSPPENSGRDPKTCPCRHQTKADPSESAANCLGPAGRNGTRCCSPHSRSPGLKVRGAPAYTFTTANYP